MRRGQVRRSDPTPWAMFDPAPRAAPGSLPNAREGGKGGKWVRRGLTLVDAEGDELFGMLPFAEGIHHIHHDERDTISVVVRVADHLGSRL